MTLTRSLTTGTLALAVAVGFTGCLQMEDKSVLAKDGSGTAVIDATFDLEKLEQLRDMAKAFMGQGEPAGEGETPKVPKLVADWSEESIKEKLKGFPGIELVKYTGEKKDGKQSVHLEFKYKDIVEYAKAGLLGFKAAELVKNEDGSWTLKLDPALGMGAMLAGAGGDAAKGEAEGLGGLDPGMFIEQLQSIIGTFEMKSKLTVPGTITETSGAKDGESTVSWTYNWKTMMDSREAKKAVYWTVSFKGEDITLKPFTHKPNTDSLVRDFLK